MGTSQKTNHLAVDNRTFPFLLILTWNDTQSCCYHPATVMHPYADVLLELMVLLEFLGRVLQQ